MYAKESIICFLLVAFTCIVAGSPLPDSAGKEKRALVYSTAYHAPVYAHAPAVISPSLYHAPAVVAHAPVTHGATSYSSFTINHPVYAHAPVVAHAPVYSAHAPVISSYYH